MNAFLNLESSHLRKQEMQGIKRSDKQPIYMKFNFLKNERKQKTYDIARSFDMAIE